MSITHEIKIIGDLEKKKSFFCKICDFPYNSYDDFFCQKEFDCCSECYLVFVECRVKEWKDGWRPDKTAIEEYNYKRRLDLNIEEKK